MFKPLPIVGGCYADDARPFSAQDCVNYLPVKSEASGTRSDGKLSPVPGMVPFSGGALHRVRGTYNAEGRFFAVIGTTLYQLATNGIRTALGVVPGTGRVSFAHNQITGGNEVTVVNGTQGFVWNTKLSTFTQITDVDFPGSAVIRYLGQYLIGVKPDGTGWFTSDLATATSYISTDTYEAESSPDLIRGLEVSQNRLLVLGTRTIEEWVNEPTDTAAFQRGAVVERGTASAFCNVIMDNSLIWLADDGIVYRLNSYTPTRISTFPIEQAIAQCDISQAFASAWEDKGHKVFYLTLPDGHTFGYDIASGIWHRRQSYGLARWRANTLTKWGDDWMAGDYANGLLYKLDWDYQKEGCDALVKERIGPVISNNENRFTVDAIALTLDVGRPGRGCIPQITGSFPDTCNDADYIATLNLSEGSGTYYQASFVSGTYPAGTSMNIVDNQLTVEFFNATAGTYTFYIDVADSDDVRSIPFECVITVRDFEITGTLPAAVYGDPYSETLTLTGLAPYSAVVTGAAVPTDITVTAVGDVLTVAWPSTPNNDLSFTLTVTDAVGCVAVREFVISTSGTCVDLRDPTLAAVHYLLLPSTDVDLSYAATDYDYSAWATGKARFDSNSSFAATVIPQHKKLWVRHELVLTTTAGLHFDFSIDDELRLYNNGVEVYNFLVTASNFSTLLDSSLFVVGCNHIAISCKDDGAGRSYLNWKFWQ